MFVMVVVYWCFVVMAAVLSGVAWFLGMPLGVCAVVQAMVWRDQPRRVFWLFGVLAAVNVPVMGWLLVVLCRGNW